MSNITREEVIEVAKSFLGYDGGEIPTDTYGVVTLASRIGVILSSPDDGEEADVEPEVYGGRVYITPNTHESSEFDYALIVAAYLLFDKSLVDVTEEEYAKCSLFGVVTQFPEIDSVLEPTLSELVTLSVKLGVPYPALRLAFA